jgi:protein SCO1/2
LINKISLYLAVFGLFFAPLVAADDVLQERVLAQFELLDANGQAVTADDFQGKYVLLGFGFTHCLHICPMMAANMGKALRLSENDAAGVFISVDTERDTPQITDAYAKKFGEQMIGLSGSYAQIVAAAKSFEVTFVVTKSDDAYTVQHTPDIFLIDPDGKVVDVFPLNATAEKMADAMYQASPP